MNPPMSSTSTPWWATNTAQPTLPATAVRKRTARTVLTALTVTALIATLGGWVLRGTTIPATETVPGGGTAYRQSTEALVGGCGPTYQFKPALTETGPVPATKNGKPNKQKYRTIVPMFGHYYAATPDAPTTTLNVPKPTRFYNRTDANIPPVEELLATMHTGTMVAWYTNDANPDDIAALKILADNPTLNMVVAPWEHAARGLLPANRKIAYSVWGASQTCQRLVTPALVAFRTAHPTSAAPGNQ